MLLLFLSHELSALIDWLVFKDEQIQLVSLNFTHSTLFTARADQLLYSLSLIKWFLACVKQNTAVKTAIDAISLLAKYTFSDLVGEPASPLMINFEQVIEPFLVLNIFFHFFSYQWLITLFTRVTVCYCYVTYASKVVVKSCSVKKSFLEISQNSQENACARVECLF